MVLALVKALLVVPGLAAVTAIAVEAVRINVRAVIVVVAVVVDGARSSSGTLAPALAIRSPRPAGMWHSKQREREGLQERGPETRR
eukprot:3970946-Alexandrium_andersonii.AAC.1